MKPQEDSCAPPGVTEDTSVHAPSLLDAKSKDKTVLDGKQLEALVSVYQFLHVIAERSNDTLQAA